MNTKKKILFLVTQSEFGGAQRFIYILISRQFTPRTTPLDAGVKGRSKGVLEAAEIVVGAGKEGDNESGLLCALEEKGIKTKHLKYLRRSINPFFDFWGLIEIYKLIKKEKPDTVFLCSTKAGFLGSLASYIYGAKRRSKGDLRATKVIYRIGGWTFNDPWPKWKKKLYIWLEKNTARFKDFIVNNAESDRQQAIKLGIKLRREILTIYNGIDTGSLRFLPSDEARSFLEGKIQLSLGRSQFTPRSTSLNAGVKGRCKGDLKAIIGTIANFYPPKGLEYLIEAANILKESDVKFIIIGEGQERAKLESKIEKYNLKNVFLTGALPEAWKYLKAFDIFVLPSIKEGFPWTIIEAMAAGIPVIATNVGAVPEILENKKNGILIELRNAEEIAESIKLLIEDKNLRETIAKEAKKTVEERFSLDRMIREVEELLVSDTNKQSL